MKSIDNLREWWRDRFPVMDRQLGCDFREHIDAIEREVEELRDRDYSNGREDAEGAVEFADRLCRASERREDVTLWGVDYTALPVDADGVPIHVGDVMEERSGHTFEVASIMVFGGSGNQLVFSDARNFSSFREPHDLRHHHAPTVEEVLREYALKCEEAGNSGPEVKRLATEYAARLMLAGEE